jgi:hypothetical protein
MWRRDLEADGVKFERWLRGRLPNARDLRMSPLVSPTSSGFSNETLLFDLAWSENGRAVQERLVVRIQPIGYQVFPEYDLGLQFRTMQLLAATDVPVPRMLWLESEDTSIFGAPFYVMAQVAGRVPTDQPPYHTGGWMTEISPPSARRSGWADSTRWRASTGRSRRHGFGFLRRPELGATPLDQEIAYYEKYYTWAARGRRGPIIGPRTTGWWRQAGPRARGLVWGDADRQHDLRRHQARRRARLGDGLLGAARALTSAGRSSSTATTARASTRRGSASRPMRTRSRSTRALGHKVGTCTTTRSSRAGASRSSCSDRAAGGSALRARAPEQGREARAQQHRDQADPKLLELCALCGYERRFLNQPGRARPI